MPELPHSFSEVLHFFTDGSCINQHDHDCRFAAWSVVLAPAHALEATECSIVDVGCLPGMVQSAYRAEIFAVLRALQCCQSRSCPIGIWTDCEAVVKRLHRILQGRVPKPNSPHSDLWIEIFHLLSQYSIGTVGVFKVAAHRSEMHVGTSVEEWCCRNNALADRAAVRANFARPPAFWTLLQSHVNALNHMRDISRQIQKVQLAVSQAQVRYCDNMQDVVVEPVQLPIPAWVPLPKLTVLPAAAARWYGCDIVRMLVSWFWQGVDPSASAMVWVSHYQLYVDFMLATGEPGPVRFKTWTNGSNYPLLGLRDVPFKKRVRWFIRVMKEILKHMHVSLHTEFCRPHSEAIAMHTGVWGLPWPMWRLQIVDQWFCERLPSAATRGGRALDSLPFASKHPHFDDLWLTSACF